MYGPPYYYGPEDPPDEPQLDDFGFDLDVPLTPEEEEELPPDGHYSLA